MPPARKRSIVYSMHGTPSNGTIGFGLLQVSGRSLLPLPPAKITAFIMFLPRLLVDGQIGLSSHLPLQGHFRLTTQRFLVHLLRAPRDLAPAVPLHRLLLPGPGDPRGASR